MANWRTLYAVREIGTDKWAAPQCLGCDVPFEKAQVYLTRNPATQHRNRIERSWRPVEAEVVELHCEVKDG
jgi:hypothetical protein